MDYPCRTLVSFGIASVAHQEISNRVARRESIILSYSVLKAPAQPDRKFRAGRLKLRRSGISFSAVQGYETVRSASASPEQHSALYAAWPRIHRLAVKSIETGAKFGRNRSRRC